MDIRPDLDSIFDAFGVPAVVTPAIDGAAAIETTVVWVSPQTTDVPEAAEIFRQPRTHEFQRREERRVCVLRRDEVPTIPMHTQIVAPELEGDDDRTWMVTGFLRTERELWHVLVVPMTE